MRSIAVIGALAILTAACAKSDAKSGNPASTTRRGTTPASEVVNARLARRASLTAADLGPKWQGYKPARGAVSEYGGCGYSARGPLSTVGRGSRYAGPLLKFKANKSYASSGTEVFPDAATAKRWVVLRRERAYRQCRRKGYQASLLHQQKGDRVVLDPITDPNVGTTVAGGSAYADFVRYDGQTPDHGHWDTTATYDQIVYRHGRTVVTFELVRSTGRPGDPKVRSVEATFARAITKVLARTTG